jgi:hypothetical protein
VHPLNVDLTDWQSLQRFRPDVRSDPWANLAKIMFAPSAVPPRAASRDLHERPNASSAKNAPKESRSDNRYDFYKFGLNV